MGVNTMSSGAFAWQQRTLPSLNQAIEQVVESGCDPIAQHKLMIAR